MPKPTPTLRPGVPPPDPGPLPWRLSPAPPPVGMAGKLAPPIAVDWATESERRALRHEAAERERAERERAERRAVREAHFGKPKDAPVALPTRINRPYDVRCPVCAAERGAFCVGRRHPHRERRIASATGRTDLSAAALRELAERLRHTLPGEAV